jgi:AsmA family/AsmA-like C-terminal region
MKRLRWLLLVLVAIAAAIALAPLVPLDPLRPEIEARLSELFNRDVQIGSMRLSLLGGPYLTMKRVTIKMAPEFGAGNLLEAERVRANLAALPLLGGNVKIEALEFDSPQVSLIRNPGGVWNWTTIGRRTAAVRHTLPVLLTIAPTSLVGAAVVRSLEKFEARNVSIRLIDRAKAGSPEKIYRNVNLLASVESGSQAGRISGVLSARSGDEGSERLKLDAPFDLTLGRSGPAIALDGRVGPAEVETANFAARQLTSSVKLQDRQLAFDQIEMNLYDGVMRGRVAFDLGDDRFTAAGAIDHLDLDSASAGKLRISGEVKGHINAEFDLRGDAGDFQQVFPTWKGAGSVSSNQLFMPRFNVSEQFARALRIDEIGEMSAGTAMAGVKGRFRLEEGLLSVEDLSVEKFDGLGQARVERGWIRLGDEPVMNYTATVTLSPEATEQVKTASLLVSAITSLLKRENRLIIPVSVTGSVRDPRVQVDVRRLF